MHSIVKTATRCGRAYAPLISKEAYDTQKRLFHIVEKSSSAQNGILSFISALVDSNNMDEHFIQEMDNLIDGYRKS